MSDVHDEERALSKYINHNWKILYWEYFKRGKTFSRLNGFGDKICIAFMYKKFVGRLCDIKYHYFFNSRYMYDENRGVYGIYVCWFSGKRYLENGQLGTTFVIKSIRKEALVDEIFTMRLK